MPADALPSLETLKDLDQWRAASERKIFIVPTMGALHEGHASLVRAARHLAGAAGRVLVSIFVNPTQFGPQEDYSRYPRTIEADLAIVQAAGGDAVFLPPVELMYPEHRAGHAHGRESAAVTVDPGYLGTVLEGALRPGHFRGVCTVVLKLLNLVQPAAMLLGQKDFQQQLILKHMARDLNVPTEILTEPTVREPDGLAMSSRNRYLSADERRRAVAIFEALTWSRTEVAARRHDAKALEIGMKQHLESRGLEVQYALAAHPHTLDPVTTHAQIGNVLLIAAKLGTTRLIDNMII